MDEAHIKALLEKAINEDGKGKDGEYFKDTGRLLWSAKPETFRRSALDLDCWLMGSTDPQVVAFFVDNEVIVTHNGEERHKVYHRP